jgi:reactive intermediate/imine deaminase
MKANQREVINTEAAPSAIGPYSQAVKAGDTVYISGQIPLDPGTGELVTGDFKAQAERVFDNLAAVAEAAGSSLANALRITVYLADMTQYSIVNEVMQDKLVEPYPARVAFGVAELPKQALVEADAILVSD